MNCPTELQDLYQAGRVIPFVGAGVSMSFSWDIGGSTIRGPSWQDMVDEAARQLGFSDPALLRARGSDLQILEYYKLKNSGKLDKLKTWLIGQLSAPDSALQSSPIHTALGALDRCKVFYTTNYDDYIERALRITGKSVRGVATASDMAQGDSYEVVKFHGDFSNMNEMVMSESEYELRLQLNTAVDFRLRSDALNRALLFVGYSFRDWNVSYLFRLLNENFKSLSSSSHGTRGFIVTPEPSEFERELFKARNIEVIGIDTLNLTGDIAELLQDMIK